MLNIITLLVDATVEALLSAAEISTDKPRSTKRTVTTQVSVYNGETVIIGGLIADNIILHKHCQIKNGIYDYGLQQLKPSLIHFDGITPVA